MNNERSAGDKITVVKFDTSFGHEVSGDFTLPDYMPELKRLLYVSSTVLPEGKFLNGGVLELSGNVSYNVVYVGEDGSLASAPLVSEYSADTALPSAVNGADALNVDTQLESTNCRATGPRSLAIKSRLKIRVMSDETADTAGGVFDGDSRPITDSAGGIERDEETVTSVCRRRGFVTESASGTVDAPEGAKPLMCEGTLNVVSAAISDGGVSVSGKICVRSVFAKADGDYVGRKTEIPFETLVPIDGDGKYDGARAWGRVASVNVAAEGEDGAYNVAVEYDLEAEAYAGSVSEICTDAYSTAFESENEMKECEVPTVIAFGSKRAEVTGEAELKNPSESANVIDMSPAVCQSQIALSDGKIFASCVIKQRVLVNSGGEIYVREIETPLRVELADAPEGASAQDIQGDVNCSADAGNASVSQGKIVASCTVDVSYSVCLKQRTRMVTSTAVGEKLPPEPPAIKVYYPERDESIWSICKKYRAGRAGVAKNNTFDGGVAPAGKPVIII